MPSKEQLYDQAEKLKDEGKLDEAAGVLQGVLADEPGYALAHSALAIVCRRMGKHREAIEHARKVCELEPNDPFSFTALSVEYQRGGFIPEAEEAMARARMLQQGM